MQGVLNSSAWSDIPDFALEVVVGLRSGDFKQVVVHCSNILVYGDVVVVYNYKQVALHCSGIVEPLKGQTAAKRPVANYCHNILSLALQLCGLAQSQRGRDGGRGVSRPECVVGTL